ncbi:MAG: pilus assembly PilX N-terminal domain-containing protein, partial [Desulfuromonadales bacterium]|nr:pilus assembly PilX N-terminal domain-containing protein [Desulfuromonadales bacterium]
MMSRLTPFRRLRCKQQGERGIALIMCIGFLALLSILGAFVLDVSNRDLKLSGQSRISDDIFFTADQAVEFSLTPNVYSNLTDVGDMADLTDTAFKEKFVPPGSSTDLYFGEVTYEGFGDTPANADKFDTTATAGKVYRYFHVFVEAGSTRPGVTERHFIDAQLAQAFPTVTNVPVTYASGQQAVAGSGGN